MNTQTGIVNIRGKEYQTVALRVQLFRDKHPEHGLNTSVVVRDDDCVVVRAEILDPAGRCIATGHAEEYRKTSQINRTSALENAETSAIGRALAAFGMGGTEFASANEVQNAIHQQREGHSQTGAVSPPVAEYAFPDGPARNVTEMKNLIRPLWREIKGCSDEGELLGLLETPEAKALIEQVSSLENPTHRRELWEGDGKDNPGLSGVIEQQKREVTAQDNEPNILAAG